MTLFSGIFIRHRSFFNNDYITEFLYIFGSMNVPQFLFFIIFPQFFYILCSFPSHSLSLSLSLSPLSLSFSPPFLAPFSLTSFSPPLTLILSLSLSLSPLSLSFSPPFLAPFSLTSFSPPLTLILSLSLSRLFLSLSLLPFSRLSLLPPFLPLSLSFSLSLSLSLFPDLTCISLTQSYLSIAPIIHATNPNTSFYLLAFSADLSLTPLSESVASPEQHLT